MAGYMFINNTSTN